MKKKKANKRAQKASPKKMPKASKERIMPLADRVLVKPHAAEGSETMRPSGIIIPETVDKERAYEGTIVAVGRGKYEDGKLIPMTVQVGDRVMYSKYGGDDVKADGTDYVILREDQILAILN